MRPELLSQIDGAKLTPVDIRRMSFADFQTPDTVQLVVANSLSFAAADLMELSSQEVILLSKRLRLMFTRIASQNGLRIKSGDLDMFKEGDFNAIEHELGHFRVIQEVRPEVAAQASINILPVVADRQLLVGMNTMIQAPEAPYSFGERVRIWMAPKAPSGPDYFELERFITANRSSLTKEEIEGLIRETESKRRTEDRDNFLKFLKGLGLEN